jgi:hypothetical protein
MQEHVMHWMCHSVKSAHQELLLISALVILLSYVRYSNLSVDLGLVISVQIEAIKSTLANEEQRVGAEIIRKALAYPLRLIASNAGVNGSVVMQKVLENSKQVPNFGYNAANDTYQDLMEAGIIDPTKVNDI